MIFNAFSYLLIFYRYRFRRNQILSKEEAEKFGIKKKDRSEVTLESEFEKVKEVLFYLITLCSHSDKK